MKIANIGGAKAAAFTYGNKEHYLLFNGLAMFALQDRYEGRGYMQMMGQDSEAGLSVLLHIVTVLAEQGELARRAIGLDAGIIMTESEWGSPALLQPKQILELRNACVDAINLGYTQEVQDEDEEIDLGLIELQKKRS